MANNAIIKMATFGSSIRHEIVQHNGAPHIPIVIYLMDNSAVTIAVFKNTTVEEAVKKISKRVGVPKALSMTFGLFMSMDGSNIDQRGLADDLIVDMNDQCPKLVFAPSLIVKQLLNKIDNDHHPIITKLMFSQLMHDFVIDNYQAITYDQSIELAALCIFAKYGHISKVNRTFKFLNPRLFEFLPIRFIKISQVVQDIWGKYNKHALLPFDRVKAMNAAIQYVRNITELEYVFKSSNCVALCKQKIISRFTSRCLIGVGYDGIRLFSLAETKKPGLRKFYPMNVISKWGYSDTTGQLFFEIETVGEGTKALQVETSRAADICDTLSEYARNRVKERADNMISGITTVRRKSDIKGEFKQTENTTNLDGFLNNKRSRRSSSVVIKENDSTQKVSVINPAFQYSQYAHYVCIMIQALWRGYNDRIAFDYKIDRIIHGLAYDSDIENDVKEGDGKGDDVASDMQQVKSLDDSEERDEQAVKNSV